MTIRYDREADALYIRLIEGPRQCRALRLSRQVALNIGEGEVVVGIEVLDAKQVLGADSLQRVVIEGLPFEVVQKA